MNDKKAGLEQMLEQVTAPSDAEPRDLGPDAQALRETWLALGRLLEAAQPPAAPLLESVAPPRTSHRRSLTALAALAASVFLALSAYCWMWGGGGKLGVALPSPDGRMASVDGPNRSAPATPHPQNSSEASELQWDDSLDEQIATVGQGLALAQSDLSHAFDAADFVRRGIQQTQQELENNKL